MAAPTVSFATDSALGYTLRPGAGAWLRWPEGPAINSVLTARQISGGFWVTNHDSSKRPGPRTGWSSAAAASTFQPSSASALLVAAFRQSPHCVHYFTQLLRRRAEIDERSLVELTAALMHYVSFNTVAHGMMLGAKHTAMTAASVSLPRDPGSPRSLLRGVGMWGEYPAKPGEGVDVPSVNRPIPTEPIGSVPRPQRLIEAAQDLDAGRIGAEAYARLTDEVVRETIEQFEATGSPVITDGEQSKPSFATYPIHGLRTLAPEGVVIPFADGHTRQLPHLTAGPFRYRTRAGGYLDSALRYAHVPVKQAVISASALSLLYPQGGLEGYPRDAFLADLINEAALDIRSCLDKGAHNVQIDFTEARLSVKLDPSKQLLSSFIDLNNQVLGRFSPEQRRRIGVHTCPGGDQDSTHSADVDYGELLPSLFDLNAGSFYIQLASEADRRRVLGIIREHARPGQMIFVGVIDPINPTIETPEEVRDRVLEAAEYLDLDRLGTCDDCGFSPFGDDTSTAREIAFEKIRARVVGTELAAKELGR